MKEAERMVNDLSVKAREDAVAESTRELQLAEERMTKIRLAMRDLRNREGVLDAQKTNDINVKMIAEMRAARINLAVQLAIGQRDLGPESRRIMDYQAADQGSRRQHRPDRAAIRQPGSGAEAPCSPTP